MSAKPFLTGYQGFMNPGLAVTIANGASESGVIKCGGMALTGVLLPAAFTGAALTFLVSDAADGTFVPLKTGVDGDDLSYTVVQATYAAIDPKDFQGVAYLKIKSGSAEAADRVLTCSLKGF